MSKNQFKLLVIAAFVFPLFALVVMSRTATQSVAAADDTPETIYKAKCAMCHSPKAEKAYDPAKPIEEQVDAILKGKKGEKPPYMPAFAEKGIDAEKATALANYMKGLRTPPAAE